MQDRTYCAQGHPYTLANTYRSRFNKRKPSGGTRVYAGRRCRTCAKIWRSIRYHLRQKGAEGDTEFLAQVVRRVEMRCEGLWVEPLYVGPARDGIEAQYGLNDIFPGDPYPPTRA